MSLLTMVQRAARIVGVSANLPAVVGSNDPTALQFLDLADEEGRSLAGRHAWQAITAGQSFVTTATPAQTGALLSDFDRFLDGTMFNRTTRKMVDGPISSREWQDIQASVITRIDPGYRLRGGVFLLTPTPPAGETIAYEYVTKNWVKAADGTAKSAFTADDDVPLFDEHLMALGIEWRFKSRKGFDHDDTLREYERLLADLIARDGGRRTIYSDERLSDGVHRWWGRRNRHDVRVII